MISMPLLNWRRYGEMAGRSCVISVPILHTSHVVVQDLVRKAIAVNGLGESAHLIDIPRTPSLAGIPGDVEAHWPRAGAGDARRWGIAQQLLPQSMPLAPARPRPQQHVGLEVVIELVFGLGDLGDPPPPFVHNILRRPDSH